ncbi:MAG TPA: PAS domain S-box protein, partial [Gaiellales bacterium]
MARTSQGGWAETAMRRAFDAIVTIDAEGVIQGWGEPAVRLFGFSDADAIGNRIGTLIVPPALRDAHEAGLRRLAAGGEATILDRRIELRGLHRDGHEIPIELLVTRGEKGLYVGFVRDLSHVRAVEQQGVEIARLLVRAEQLVGMGSWALDLRSGEVIWSDELYRLH